MQAKYEYRGGSGNVLVIPKHGNAPMLFLEFLRDYSKSQKRVIIPKIINITGRSIDELDFFFISLTDELKQTYINAVEYINNNNINLNQELFN